VQVIFLPLIPGKEIKITENIVAPVYIYNI
jgi:hypothetical protein